MTEKNHASHAQPHAQQHTPHPDSGVPVGTAPTLNPVNPEPAQVIHCRVRNPSLRPKVIYGGEWSTIMYHIPAGATIEANLPDHLLDTLAEQESADPEEPGLHVEELGAVEPPPPPPQRQSRRPRPGRTSPQ